MRTYEEFVEDAISNFGSLPSEPNDLYKKYTLELPQLEKEPAMLIDINLEELSLEKVSKEVSEKVHLKFDAILSAHAAKSFNGKVRIVSPKDLDSGFMGHKMLKSSDDRLSAFANASTDHFLFIDSKDGESKHVNLLFIGTSRLSVQVIANAGKESRLDMVEIYLSGSDDPATVSSLHEVKIGESSSVELTVIHNENQYTDVMGVSKSIAQSGSKLSANFVYVGGIRSKTRNFFESNGTDSKIEVTEVAYGSGDQKFDISSIITNASPKSVAMLDSGVLLDGRSQCMLKGFAKIGRCTKGCVSKITERGILLSKDAHLDALPDMSIDYSNDVKATHSAASSPMDEEALFYLQSRGLSETSARKAFITAFISKYLSKMSDGVANEVAMSIMLEKLESGLFGAMPEITPKGVWAAYG
ncbi:MAG: SufD family Fe-S cluster assembly protein [Candidatus Marsarchaeota archaeon]|nr:SufD family Fe-S cluster assembly protein [Candidatus Marsarchaeota archaeon]MCL5413246.1 SufD family Fe-S cluster assembly protein [Candidatus Marsarchaeota archaeon]